ncbi:MAG: PDDEXK nuclease domain-containing protein [Sulfurisoma sp.]|nr:PDDEXK nuclease domain-containing protein [Sulfurisoma sp.]
MGSLYFERSGLSTDKNKLAAYVQMKAELSAPVLNVRDPYVFEFLGIKPQEVMYESDVEDAILDNLQQFLLEMGHGFCFEARQKRILIGDEHYFIDLVFYHRILKCHVLVELKLAEFSSASWPKNYGRWALMMSETKIVGRIGPQGLTRLPRGEKSARAGRRTVKLRRKPY